MLKNNNISSHNTVEGITHMDDNKLCNTIDELNDRKNKFPLIAIDGGGTKTYAVITDKVGKVLIAKKAGSSNYQVAGKQLTIENIKNAINQAVYNLQTNETPTFTTGIFALAGIDTEKDREIAQDIVKQAIKESRAQIDNTIVENDALSVLLGATNQHPGAILIAGTGSIAFAHDGKGNFVRAGGWGHKLGDEGAGFWIGKEALRAILKSFDGRNPETILMGMVLNHYGLENHEQLYNWVYGDRFSVHNIGEIATMVDTAFKKGDIVSKNILDRAVDELFHLISAVVKRANILDKSFKLIMLGGVLQNNSYVRRELTLKVKENIPGVIIDNNYLKPIEYIIQRGLNST